MRHWLGFGGRSVAEGAGTASSGGALGALADAASGGACLCATCAELADREADQGFTPPPPSLPARTQGNGGVTSGAPAAEVAEEGEPEGKLRAPPLPCREAVHPVAHRTRHSPLKAAAAAEAVEPATGALAVLLEPVQLMRKRSSSFNLPAGCPEGPWPSDTMALSAINRWASDHTKVGGSWGVTWLEGRRKGNSARGPQHGLGCDQHKKQGCGWSGRLEETTEGWMWYSFTEHKGAEGKRPASERCPSCASSTARTAAWSGAAVGPATRRT
jgi:hypothetical protein